MGTTSTYVKPGLALKTSCALKGYGVVLASLVLIDIVSTLFGNVGVVGPEVGLLNGEGPPCGGPIISIVLVKVVLYDVDEVILTFTSSPFLT